MPCPIPATRGPAPPTATAVTIGTVSHAAAIQVSRDPPRPLTPPQHIPDIPPIALDTDTPVTPPSATPVNGDTLRPQRPTSSPLTLPDTLLTQLDTLRMLTHL